MSKKIFIVSSTPRKNGNSDILAEEFARGAREAGHSVEKVCLREIEFKFCTGCMSCHTRGTCVLKDGIGPLLPRIADSDVLVFATPVYYYEMSGQLKTFLDRTTPLYGRDNRFKEVYLLASSADTEESAMDGAVKGVQGWTDCFEDVSFRGIVRGTGAEKAGDIRATNAVVTAYEMGKSV